MKRCIVFFFYDKDGVVDRYIFHILQDLVQRSERIVFVCNGKLVSIFISYLYYFIFIIYFLKQSLI